MLWTSIWTIKHTFFSSRNNCYFISTFINLLFKLCHYCWCIWLFHTFLPAHTVSLYMLCVHVNCIISLLHVDWINNDAPIMKRRNSFFKQYHVRPFINGTSFYYIKFKINDRCIEARSENKHNMFNYLFIVLLLLTVCRLLAGLLIHCSFNNKTTLEKTTEKWSL